MSKHYEEQKIRENYRNLTKLLIEKGLTVTTMESITAGQIASLITDTEGSSAVLKGAFVTYCNEAKIQQGVPAEILNRYTVYSCETACAMADAARRVYAADLSIGVTGTAGNPDPENPAASVPGRACFAVSYREETKGYSVEIPPQPSRLAYKLAAAQEVYEAVTVLLSQPEQPENPQQ